MDPNDKLFDAKLEVPRIRAEIAKQGKASNQIGLGWSEQIKDNQRRSE